MANKVMTVLEARIPQEHWAALVEKAKELPALPPGLEQSFFVQDTSEPDRWRTVGTGPAGGVEDVPPIGGNAPANGDVPFLRRNAHAHPLRNHRVALRRDCSPGL